MLLGQGVHPSRNCSMFVISQTPSNYLTMEKAKGGKFPIPPTLSQPALDLIKQMLAVAKEDRIAMKDLLQHPWVQRFSAQSEGPATPVLEQLVKEWRSAKKTQQRSEEKKEEGEGLEAVQVNVEAVRRAGDESSSEAVADLARSIASAKTVSVSALRELLLPLPAALQKQLQYQLWLRRVPLQVFWAFQSDDAAGRLSLIHHFLCDFEGESVLGHNQLSQGEFKDVDIACVPLLEGDKDAVIEHWRSAAQYLASRKRQPKVVFALSPGNWSEDVVKRSEVLDSTTLVVGWAVGCSLMLIANNPSPALLLRFLCLVRLREPPDWLSGMSVQSASSDHLPSVSHRCQGVRVLVLPPNPSSSDFGEPALTMYFVFPCPYL